MDNPVEFQKTDYAISLGVHCWQPPEELEKFKTLLADYAHRDDFWYCNETEFASYRLAATHTTIANEPEKQGVFTLTRPTVDVIGNAVPLTIAITGPKTAAVKLDGKTLDIKPAGKDRWLVNLPYPATQQLPAIIDWVRLDDAAKVPRRFQRVFPIVI